MGRIAEREETIDDLRIMKERLEIKIEDLQAKIDSMHRQMANRRNALQRHLRAKEEELDRLDPSPSKNKAQSNAITPSHAGDSSETSSPGGFPRKMGSTKGVFAEKMRGPVHGRTKSSLQSMFATGNCGNLVQHVMALTVGKVAARRRPVCVEQHCGDITVARAQRAKALDHRKSGKNMQMELRARPRSARRNGAIPAMMSWDSDADLLLGAGFAGLPKRECARLILDEVLRGKHRGSCMTVKNVIARIEGLYRRIVGLVPSDLDSPFRLKKAPVCHLQER